MLTIIKKLSKITKTRRFRIAAVSTIVFLILLFTLILPAILRSQAEKQLAKFLKRDVTVESIYFNPLTLSLTINNLAIKEKDSTFVGFDKFYLNMESWSAFKLGLVVKEVTLTNPRINITRQNDSTYNFSDLLPKKEDAAPIDTAKKGKFNFSVSNINIIGGRITFNDLPKGKNHTLDSLTLSVPFISNFDYLAEVYSQPYFSVLVNRVPFKLEGKTKPFDKTLESVIDFNLADLDLTEYLEYVPVPLNFKLKSALFSMQTKLAYAQVDGKPRISLSGEMALKNLAVHDLNDSLLAGFSSLNIGLDTIEAVTKKIRLGKIALQGLTVKVERDARGRINLLQLAPPKAEKQPSAPVQSSTAEPETPLDLLVKKIAIDNGKIAFHDHQGRDFKTALEKINLNINNFSLDKTADLALHLQTINREKIGLTSRFNLADKEFTGEVKIDSVQLPLYASFLPQELDVKTGGFFSFITNYRFKQTLGEPEVELSGLGAELRSLSIQIKSTKEKITEIGRLAIRGAVVNLAAKSLTVDSVIIANNRANVKISKDGTINLATLYHAPLQKTPTAKPVETAETAQPQWIALVKNLQIANNRVDFQDLSKAEPLEMRLDKINLKLKDFTNKENSPTEMDFSMLIGKKGSLKTGGRVGLFPLNCNLNLAINNVSITPAQVYLADKINIALTSGNFSTKGRVIVQKKGADLLAAYSGGAGVKDFVTINKESADNFLLWKDLQLNKINFNLQPFSLEIDEIKMQELYSLLNIYKDGTTNLQQIMKKDSTKIKTDSLQTAKAVAAAPPVKNPEPATETRNIRINRVTLDNCNINFSDQRFKNTFSANMKELSGAITGLSSKEDVTADVKINGKYDSYAPILIAGKINPLAKNLFLDLLVSFKDIDLTQMNPYSQKYMGYVIEKGKLSIDLQYLVKDRKLDSKNNILLDQLTLGDKVESKDATSLPVKLALAILRDTEGDIKLDVPITGSLDDPQFNIGKLVLQVLGNVITKAVLSPFSALSSLFGGGDELSFVAYAPGQSVISEAERVKLDKIAAGMTKKKNLTIEIAGYADPTVDLEGLKNEILNQKIQTARIKEGLKTKTVEATGTANISAAEYEKYLIAVYKSEPFKKETNMVGMVKSQPVEVMKKLILANLEVKDDDYKQLAIRRAVMVKDYLINEKKMDTSRIFLLQSKDYKPQAKENMPATRAEFMLKAE